MVKICPICHKEVKNSNLRIHIIKHSEISIERRIECIESLVNSTKRRKKIRSRKPINHSTTPTKIKDFKSNSIHWDTTIKTNFESNRKKF